MNNSILKITSVSEERTSSDDRKYKLVGFQPFTSDGVLSNQKERRRTIWQEGPAGSAGDAIYPHLKVGAKVYGDIETILVEPYFIESEYGKFQHPETGHPANKVEQYTQVVFESENIETLARQNDLTPQSESDEFETVEETVNEDAEMSIT